MNRELDILVKKLGYTIIYEDYENVKGVLVNEKELSVNNKSNKVLLINKNLFKSEKEYYIALAISYLKNYKVKKFVLLDDIKETNIILEAINILLPNLPNNIKHEKSINKKMVKISKYYNIPIHKLVKVKEHIK